MTLNDYLSLHGISKTEFSNRIDTTLATVSRIADGQVVPRRELLRRIFAATDGAVTPNDLVGLGSDQKHRHQSGSEDPK